LLPSRARFVSASAVASLAAVFVGAVACTPFDPPVTREVVELSGTPYERGLEHGTKLRSKIRSFYTTMLSASLLPYVNREKPDISAALPLYQGPEYDDFSYKLLLESAQAMKKHIGKEHLEEMRGIADGSGLTQDQVLILNTFVDAVMATRAVALALRLSRAPQLKSFDFGAALATDKVDNDGDGKTDEKGEGTVPEYFSSSIASAVELPLEPTIKWVITDPEGVDPATIRAQLDTRVYTSKSPEITIKELPGGKDKNPGVEVTLKPGKLPSAAVVSLVVMAGDKEVVDDPPPVHARFMRDERVVFTTRGAGKEPHEVANTGVEDGRSQPPASAFAVRGTATVGGKVILAQHFSLLDANTSHKHTAVFVHRPANGKPFAVVGWAGVIWGFSGISARGLAATVNYSDTLNNSIVGGLLPKIGDLASAKLITEGVPIGLAIRAQLEKEPSAIAAAKSLETTQHTFGWNVLFADAKGDMRIAEIDSSGGGRAFVWGPGKDKAGLDDNDKPLASVGPDDLRIGAHYVKNTDDMFDLDIKAGAVPIRIRRQAGWSSYYFSSLRTSGRLAGMLKENYGKIDVPLAQQMLAHPALVDTSDGMNAVVLEPSELRLHTAMGSVPATDSPFEPVEVPAQ